MGKIIKKYFPMEAKFMKKNKKLIKILIVIFTAIFLFCLTKIYQSIEVKTPQEYNALRTAYPTENSQTVENEEQKSQTIADINSFLNFSAPSIIPPLL